MVRAKREKSSKFTPPTRRSHYVSTNLGQRDKPPPTTLDCFPPRKLAVALTPGLVDAV